MLAAGRRPPLGTARPVARNEPIADAGGGSALGLQCIAATAGTAIGQALGPNIVAKLLAGVLLTVVGAFLTAPGRHHRRRIVAVALLLALLHALRRAGTALASASRSRPRGQPPAEATPSAWVPVSWAAIGLTAVVGFAIGSGVTTARGGWTDEKRDIGPPTLTIPDVPGQPQPGPGPIPDPPALGDPGGSEEPGGSGEPGVTTVEVPEVTGLDEKEASAKLRDASLNPEIEEQESESVAAGTVMETIPEAGTPVEPSSSVTVIVSSGVAESENVRPETPKEIQ